MIIGKVATIIVAMEIDLDVTFASLLYALWLQNRR